MRAVILAAGRGRRLGADQPKCLHEVGGESMLVRMLGALRRAGVARASLVLGYRDEDVRAAVAALPQGGLPEVSFLQNERYERGSILSLYRVRQELFGQDDLLVMDADVVFPDALLTRLLGSSYESAFLLDRRATASGEEMMLVAREDTQRRRVLRIARRVRPAPGDVVGEGVGFLKLARAHQPALAAVLDDRVERGELDLDYEQALDRWLPEAEVGYEETAGLPWTEVDFAEDLERAEREVLPALEAQAAAAGAPAGEDA